MRRNVNADGDERGFRETLRMMFTTPRLLVSIVVMAVLVGVAEFTLPARWTGLASGVIGVCWAAYLALSLR